MGKSARGFGIVALGLFCPVLAAPGCSKPFHACEETRTCAPSGAGSGTAGEAGAGEDSELGGIAGTMEEASEVAGQDGHGAGAGGTADADAGAGGMSGAANETSSSEKPDGVNCVRPTDCISGSCTTFFKDADADGFGSRIAAESAAFCGTSPPAGYAANTGDCCDSDKNAKPGQTSFFPASNACDSFDYNCNGAEDLDPEQKHVAVEACNTQTKTCSVNTGWVGIQETACGEDFYWRTGSCSYVASAGSCAYDRAIVIVRCH